jgi:hypothetical protein
MVAAYNGHIQVLKILLAWGCDALAVTRVSSEEHGESSACRLSDA